MAQNYEPLSHSKEPSERAQVIDALCTTWLYDQGVSVRISGKSQIVSVTKSAFKRQNSEKMPYVFILVPQDTLVYDGEEISKIIIDPFEGLLVLIAPKSQLFVGFEIKEMSIMANNLKLETP